ncbi:hypothetical protein M3J09_002006 [Ascochyta lentis]
MAVLHECTQCAVVLARPAVIVWSCVILRFQQLPSTEALVGAQLKTPEDECHFPFSTVSPAPDLSVILG